MNVPINYHCESKSKQKRNGIAAKEVKEAKIYFNIADFGIRNDNVLLSLRFGFVKFYYFFYLFFIV